MQHPPGFRQKPHVFCGVPTPPRRRPRSFPSRLARSRQHVPRGARTAPALSFCPPFPGQDGSSPVRQPGDPGELLLRFPNDVAAPCTGTPRLLSFPFLVHCAGDRILSPLFHWQPPFRRLPLPKKQKKQHPTLSAAPLDLQRALCQGREQPCRSLLLLLASPCSSPSCCWLRAAEQEGEEETSSVGSPSLSSLTENTFFFLLLLFSQKLEEVLKTC